MIVNARIVRYMRDHPLRIWHKGDISAVKVRSASYCCDEMRELWNLKAVSLNGKTGKIWLYTINPCDIDYGSEAEMTECKFCPACGQEIRIVNEDPDKVPGSSPGRDSPSRVRRWSVEPVGFRHGLD